MFRASVSRNNLKIMQFIFICAKVTKVINLPYYKFKQGVEIC